MLLLANTHGWNVPQVMQSRLEAVTRRRLAFLGAVWFHRHRVQPHQQTGTHLGDLPNSVIEAIACAADIHFSWIFDA